MQETAQLCEAKSTQSTHEENRRFRDRLNAEQAQAARRARKKDELFRYLKVIANGAKKNALSRGRQFDLDDDWLWSSLEKNGRKCEVTLIPFNLSRCETNRAPFSPSIDRIDTAIGYTRKNSRLVCQMANLAMNVWDVDALYRFIRQAHDNLTADLKAKGIPR